MRLIAAVGRGWEIGKDGGLLFSIPEDKRFFRSTTLGKVVVMGRKTLESLPDGKPFDTRINVVLTKNAQYKLKNAIVRHSVDDVLELARSYRPENVFIIGGQMIYEQLLVYCDTAYITKVDAAAQADRFFPNVDAMENWTMKSASEWKAHGDLRFKFCEYVNSAPRAL